MTLKRSLKTIALALAVAAAVVAAGCGEKSEQVGGEPERFDLALDFFINPDHAGIYTALERGYFTEAGLDVRPRVPSDPAAPIKQVAAGQVDLAISYEPEVFLARESGLDVVAVASIVDEPLTSVIWIADSPVKDIADLEGRTLATAGIPYQTAFLAAIAEEAGIDPSGIKQVDVGLNLQPAVLSGRAAAMLGGFRNVEGVNLAERGEDPTVLPVDQLGVPTYDELVLVASRERADEDPEAIRLFVEALARGTRAAAQNPAEATRVVLDAGEGLDPKLTRAETDATLPLLLPAEGEPYGEMDEDAWQEFGAFLFDKGLLNERPDATETLTNDLLPSRGP